MTFDPKSLLTAPALTVDDLAAKLAHIKAAGLGITPIVLPDGSGISDVELVAQGETQAHFKLKGK
jgi:hypothetical protein